MNQLKDFIDEYPWVAISLSQVLFLLLFGLLAYVANGDTKIYLFLLCLSNVLIPSILRFLFYDKEKFSNLYVKLFLDKIVVRIDMILGTLIQLGFVTKLVTNDPKGDILFIGSFWLLQKGSLKLWEYYQSFRKTKNEETN